MSSSRVSRMSTPDIFSIAKAVAHPGIDPRLWVSDARVLSYGVDAQGAFANVELQPSLVEVAVRVASLGFVAPGSGVASPLRPDDAVLVVFPNGDMDQSGVVVARLWGAVDTPPTQAQDDAPEAQDLLVVAEEGQTVRVIVRGAGNVVVDAQGSGKVLLGAAEDTEPVALAPGTDSNFDALKNALYTAVTGELFKISTAINAIVPGAYIPGAAPSTPSVGATKVEGI